MKRKQYKVTFPKFVVFWSQIQSTNQQRNKRDKQFTFEEERANLPLKRTQRMEFLSLKKSRGNVNDICLKKQPRNHLFYVCTVSFICFCLWFWFWKKFQFFFQNNWFCLHTHFLRKIQNKYQELFGITLPLVSMWFTLFSVFFQFRKFLFFCTLLEVHTFLLARN